MIKFDENLVREVTEKVNKSWSKKPRDPERIDKTLNIIKRIWKQHPDLRITQLMSIAASKYGWPRVDLFYLEEDMLIDGLLKFEKEIEVEK
jgi:uncharacterized protein YihD (DUF1040 family)